jgi:hypothetical protein
MRSGRRRRPAECLLHHDRDVRSGLLEGPRRLQGCQFALVGHSEILVEGAGGFEQVSLTHCGEHSLDPGLMTDFDFRWAGIRAGSNATASSWATGGLAAPPNIIRNTYFTLYETQFRY